MKTGWILTFLHLSICVLTFILFGIGLEGDKTGAYILQVLLQPVLFIFEGTAAGGLFVWLLFFINSMIWGFGLAWVIHFLFLRISKRN